MSICRVSEVYSEPQDLACSWASPSACCDALELCYILSVLVEGVGEIFRWIEEEGIARMGILIAALLDT